MSNGRASNEIKVLGVQIAHGFSPEARVFAALLRGAEQCGLGLRAHVLHHDHVDGRGLPTDGNSDAARFARAAPSAAVETLDFGWRPLLPGRGVSDRLVERLRLARALPGALARARRERPDLVYSSQQVWDCLTATWLARRLRRPQVIHLHYIVGPFLGRPVLRRLLSCDHVITVSDFIRGEALRHGVTPARTTTIHNTLPAMPPPVPDTRERMRRELGVADDAPLAGIVARVDPTKGQADTLEAFALAREQGSCPADARLLVVGGETPWHPGYRGELERRAAALGLRSGAQPAVLFLGARPDVPDLLTALDVFIHPSRCEPFGLAVAEASSAGLPVVAYAEGALPELIEDGVTGLLAPSGDVEGLASRLGELLSRPERARVLGAAGMRRVSERFHPGDASRTFRSVIGAVVDVEGAPRPARAASPALDGPA